MATRKIIDAKHNGEKVWLKGHAQATYLSNGSTVEDALNSIQSGGITAETDPIFLSSPAASITEAKKTEWDNKMDKVVLSPVATSGNYNDLTNKPTIPASVTESTVSGWGFTKTAGTISQIKINGSIVTRQTDGLMDIGSYQVPLVSGTNIKTVNGESILGSGNITISGTITGVSANGTSVATSGVANIPAATTSKYGVTKLSSATNSTSTTLAATASAVKAAYDLANSYKGTVTGVKINGTTKNPTSGVVDLGTVITDISGKQDKLVSGTNIKTINGTSILGSGDITISGGETVTEVKVNGISKSPSNGVIDLGYINKQLSTSISSSMVIKPNMYYRNTSTSLASLTITLFKEDVNGILNEYFVEFTTRSSGTTVSLPSNIKWANGTAPTFEAGTTYQISIVNKLGTWVKFK